jgi:thioesterase domain-containing protein
VTIRPGGARTPFFCVHGAGGNVLNFRDLARAMDEAQPFYGLQARGVDGVTAPHASIEEMAAAYLAEVRELQPEGPYLLGGYSGGGMVAFEMARLLTSAGQQVPLLAFLDTFHPEMPIRKVTMGTRLERLRDEPFGYLAEAVSTRWTAWRRATHLRAVARYVARGEPLPLALRDFHMVQSFERAAAKYRPRPWRGSAVLFRAARVAYIYRDGGHCYGWDRHVLGGVDVVPISGDHSTVVLGANAVVVARALSQAMARVRHEPSSPLPVTASPAYTAAP